VLKTYYGENVFAYIPPATGKKDDLLMLAEEYPNEQGIRFFGINTDTKSLVNKIKNKQIKVLFILENNLAKFKEAKELMDALKMLEKTVYFTSFQDETAKNVSIIIPIRTFAETNGTYINATSLLQKAEQAFEPENPDIVSLPLVLAQIVYYLNKTQKRYSDPSEIFNEYKNQFQELKDYMFSNIPAIGIQLSLPKIADEPFKNKKVDFNVFMLNDYVSVTR
jgi:NADH dehydrogenase/NADH:ubiquinone oxidoreductase subunit G